MASSSDRLAWLERVYSDDTMLALEMLCIATDQVPELAEIERSLKHIELMVSIHRLRLLGVDVERRGTLWVLGPVGAIGGGA